MAPLGHRGAALPVRWELFCKHYVSCFNATEAALAAGFSPGPGIKVQGSELLRRPQIKERIRQLTEPNVRRMEATRERVIEELCKIAYSDVRELYDDYGRLKPIHELADHVAATISEVVEETRFEGRGEDREEVRTKRVKNWDKMKALEMLSKHLQLYSDAANVVVPVQVNVDVLRNLSPEQQDLVRRLAQTSAEQSVASAGEA